jgi:hypothetical protein
LVPRRAGGVQAVQGRLLRYGRLLLLVALLVALLVVQIHSKAPHC